ncbi:PilZ domain-containing protein [Denitromonas iodatirespirans]|uniref:PilZ domain-containing protein n=1 Tax=Denitromonas iodatirespirans TaxID=2795389 RepID=A0A944DF02_DENI1|nr:PilZ domain-containing protein [Denitromonas iodatirespirans]MBT0963193.1 PilZ domain-containing protein [Denitromonas iodatirespirans]
MNDVNERRQRQRILVETPLVAAPGFRLECDGKTAAVRDVSLEGFSMHVSTAPDSHHAFDFVLTRDGADGAITGRAQVVNFIRGATAETGIAGCHVTHFEGNGRELLVQWLSAHVAAVASVPLTEQEARAIVDGPSLV